MEAVNLEVVIMRWFILIVSDIAVHFEGKAVMMMYPAQHPQGYSKGGDSCIARYKQSSNSKFQLQQEQTFCIVSGS